MPKQFRKIASVLTVLGLLASFSISANNVYAESTVSQDSTQEILNVVSDSMSRSRGLLRIQDSSDLEDMLLDIDWGYDFDNEYYEEEVENGFYYVINNRNEAIVTDYDGSATNLVIPSTLGGKPVKMIYYSAFTSLDKLKSVTISQGVEVIGASAFAACDNLTKVTIPSSVKTIDTLAFALDLSLNNVVVPSSVTKLGAGVFLLNSNLTNVTLPSSISTIPDSTFAGCESLSSIKLPSSIKTIGDSAFAMTGFSQFTVPNGVTTIGDEAFSDCEKLTDITIPKSVTKIGKSLADAGAEVVTIHGETGSYAETYAKQNDLAFKATNTTVDEKVIATGVTTANLNVRKGAGANYARIGGLTKGAKVEVVKKESNGWYKIKYNNTYGYVSGTYVKLDSQTPDPTPDPQPEEKVIATGVTTENLNVRKGAGASYTRLGTLTKGAKVEVVKKESNGWYKIKYNNTYGYVSGTYVKLDSQTPDPTPDPQPEEKVIATGVTTENLNVRKGAGASYTRLGTLTKGTKVEIVKKESNGWYKIKYNNTYGYVSGTYVKLDSQTPDPTPDPKPEDEVIAKGTTTGNLNVRKGAGTSYASIGVLKKGTKVEIVKKESNGWYKIKYNNSYGYVSGKYVKLS